MELQSILNQLEGVRKQSGGYQAKCPNHEDKIASLSMVEKDGKILLHCHAGCETNAILDKLGLEAKDLFSDNGYKTSNEPLNTYNYLDENGNLIYQVCRYPGKKFIHRRPDGAGGWIYNMNGVKRVPYELPIVMATIKAGQPVYIVEGEKDVKRLHSIGLAATCNSGGAGKWLDSFADCFKGARVAIIPDNDQPGRKHAQMIAKSLFGKVAIKIVNLPGLNEKEDVSDWLDAANTKEDLIKLVKETEVIHHPPAIEDCDVRMNNLLPIVHLHELDEPEPMTFIVEDMLPENYLSVIFGDGGNGKSLLSLTLACCVATGMSFLDKQVVKSNVLYLDFELEEKEQTRRAYKAARGLGLERPPKGLFYLQPGSDTSVPLKLNDLVNPLRATVEANDIRLVVVDSAGMAISGDAEKASDIISLFQALRELKVSILLIDHQSKLKQGESYEGKSAFGSVYKSNLARSIFQVHVVDNQEGLAKAVLRQTKSNFTAKAEPIGISMSFGNNFTVSIDEEALELANQSKTIDSTWQSIREAFTDLGGKATAKQVIDHTGIPGGTVRNKISQHKSIDIIDTGQKDDKAPIYELLLEGTDHSSSLPTPYGDRKDDERELELTPSANKLVSLCEQVGLPIEAIEVTQKPEGAF